MKEGRADLMFMGDAGQTFMPELIENPVHLLSASSQTNFVNLGYPVK